MKKLTPFMWINIATAILFLPLLYFYIYEDFLQFEKESTFVIVILAMLQIIYILFAAKKNGGLKFRNPSVYFLIVRIAFVYYAVKVLMVEFNLVYITSMVLFLVTFLLTEFVNIDE